MFCEQNGRARRYITFLTLGSAAVLGNFVFDAHAEVKQPSASSTQTLDMLGLNPNGTPFTGAKKAEFEARKREIEKEQQAASDERIEKIRQAKEPARPNSPAAQQQLDALEKDAEAGDKNAQFRLGTMYLAVSGLPALEEKGRVWLKRAAAQGHIEARQKLAQLGYPNGFNFDSDGKFVPTKPTDISWESLSEKPPIREPNYFDKYDEPKPKVSPAPSARTLVHSDERARPNDSSGLSDEELRDASKKDSAATGNAIAFSYGTVAVGVLLAFASCYFLFWLLGKSVQGSTSVATGRRWMNWVVLLVLMQPLTKFFSQSIGGYGNPWNALAQGVAGAVVLGLTAFVAGALWSRFRPATQQAITKTNVEVEQHQNGLMSESAGSPEPTEEYWSQALNELESDKRRPGLWAKAYANSQGNEAQAKAYYLSERAKQLLSEANVANEVELEKLAPMRKRFIDSARLSTEDLMCLARASDLDPSIAQLTDVERGETLLHWCARLNLEQEGSILLKNGANPNASNGKGMKPFSLADGGFRAVLFSAAEKT